MSVESDVESDVEKLLAEHTTIFVVTNGRKAHTRDDCDGLDGSRREPREVTEPCQIPHGVDRCRLCARTSSTSASTPVRCPICGAVTGPHVGRHLRQQHDDLVGGGDR